MTIKELADVAGVSVETIRRKGKLLFPGMHTRGVKTHYTENQCRTLISEVKKKNMVSALPQSKEVVPHSVEVDYEAIGKMISIAVSSAMKPIIDNIKTMQTQPSQKALTAPEMDYRAMLNQIVRKYAKSRTEDNMQEAWGVLYEELYYRCHVSIRTRANNSGRSKLDEIESANLLESAYLIMVEKLGE